MISLAPPRGTRCPECGHLPQQRVLHRHLDGGDGAICAAFVDRPNPDSFGRLCGCVSCPNDITDEIESESR